MISGYYIPGRSPDHQRLGTAKQRENLLHDVLKAISDETTKKY